MKQERHFSKAKFYEGNGSLKSSLRPGLLWLILNLALIIHCLSQKIYFSFNFTKPVRCFGVPPTMYSRYAYPSLKTTGSEPYRWVRFHYRPTVMVTVELSWLWRYIMYLRFGGIRCLHLHSRKTNMEAVDFSEKFIKLLLVYTASDSNFYHRLHWMRIFVVFLRLSKQILV
jgi:hypothetical protein